MLFVAIVLWQIFFGFIICYFIWKKDSASFFFFFFWRTGGRLSQICSMLKKLKEGLQTWGIPAAAAQSHPPNHSLLPCQLCWYNYLQGHALLICSVSWFKQRSENECLFFNPDLPCSTNLQIICQHNGWPVTATSADLWLPELET